MKVLVCIDGSAFSEKILEFSTRLLGGGTIRRFLKRKHEVTLLHVKKKDAKSEYMSERIDEEIKAFREIEHKEWREPWQEMLMKGKRMLNRGGIEAKTKLREGDTAHQILEESRAGYDLLIIGSHGTGSLDILLGHTSQNVMKESRIPVLIVKQTK